MPATSKPVFLTPQMVIVTSTETASSNLCAPIPAFITDVASSSVVIVSTTPLHITPMSVGLPTDLSVIGDNPTALTQVLELLKSHGHGLQNLSTVSSSSQQQVVYTGSLAKPVMSTNIEYSSMVSSDFHTHGGSEDEFVMLKTLKGKNKKRVRDSARIRELSESGKKTRMTKSDAGFISTVKALNDIFYDNFDINKYTMVKTRRMIIEQCFTEESLSEICSIYLLVSGRLLSST